MGWHTVRAWLGRSEHGRGWLSVCAGLALAVNALVWCPPVLAVVGGHLRGGEPGVGASVAVTDNDAGKAMFTPPALRPGDSVTRCVGVKYSGSVPPAGIRMYTAAAQEADHSGPWRPWANDTTSELDDYLHLAIQINDTDLAVDPGNTCTPDGGGVFRDITGASSPVTLRSLIGGHRDYATGVDCQWGHVTANRWRIFKLTYTFSHLAPPTAQGDGLTFNFVWEAQH